MEHKLHKEAGILECYAYSVKNSDIEEKILESYSNQSNKNRDKLINYFIANKLKNLMEHIGEF